MRKLTSVLLLLPCVICAQPEERDVWEPLRFFVGSWEGAGKGCPGVSTGERKYQFILNGQFLEVRTTSVYEPQGENSEGEIHEDWGIISYDGSREKFVFRQFHAEGFVNQYVLDSLVWQRKALVFLTESIENIPPGWRARITCTITNDDEFIEVFELAGPEKDFEVYVENRFRRKR